MGDAAFRIGLGYDLHRLEPRPPHGKGRALIVGGVELDTAGIGPHAAGIGPIAHSDGDVLYHAVVDALLGALALPDIGQLFPDNAPENDGRNSEDFVVAAVAQMRSRGWEVGNLDATVILEKPRLSPVKEQIRANLCRLLALDASCVNIKGKSHEKVDAVGESRAIECHAAVLLIKS